MGWIDLNTVYLPTTGGTVSGDLNVNGNLSVPAISAAPIADYVVASGTCDFWTYRMWASGIAECWGETSSVTASISNAWGSMYESTTSFYNTFPGGASSFPFSVTINGVTYTQLFKDTPPYVDIAFHATSGYAISGIEIMFNRTALRTENFYLLRPGEAGTGSVTGSKSYYAAGLWK